MKSQCSFHVLVLSLLFTACAPSGAQTAEQIVPWAAELQAPKPLSAGSKATALLHATIKDGWHVYALSQGPGGPTPLTVKLQEGPVFVLAGDPSSSKPLSLYDQNFEMQTEFYEHTIAIEVPLTIHASAPVGSQEATFDVRFQTCNERTCLPPTTAHVPLQVEIAKSVPTPINKLGKPAQSTLVQLKRTTSVTPPVQPKSGEVKAKIFPDIYPDAKPQVDLPEPSAATAVAPQKSSGSTTASPAAALAISGRDLPQNLTAQGFGSFIWLAIVMGALSLLTPCVFPMIPITVSYFANHAGTSRRSSIAKAAVYAGGIILTFSAVGMLLAVAFGAGGVNRLAANPWVNLFITVVFLGFALSLFGAFFLQIPLKLTQRLDSLSRSKESSGVVGALLMGILFTLTSFTCTAPFVGTLLVMATQGNWRWPMAGMVAFSSIFAIPFFLLALAPQIMSSLPKAGGWMNSVKVVMGFLEVAAAMKFLSNADLVFGWGIFTRQTVLSIWIAVGLLIVLYLLGTFRMSHDSPVTVVTAPRTVFSIVFLSITVWLVTGLFGYSMGELEAFLPPPAQDSLSSISEKAASAGESQWILNDFAAAKTQAAKEHKPIFIDFTGYTCTNCRWMEANMFPRPEIQAAMAKFILVRLYTDGDGKLYEEQQEMQKNRFGTVALPLYVLLSPDGSLTATFPGLTRNPQQFLNFLHQSPVS